MLLERPDAQLFHDRQSVAYPEALNIARHLSGPVAGLVEIEGGVVSGVFNLESSGVRAPDWRPRHDEAYHEA
jgi:hypothetical protein